MGQFLQVNSSGSINVLRGKVVVKCISNIVFLTSLSLSLFFSLSPRPLSLPLSFFQTDPRVSALSFVSSLGLGLGFSVVYVQVIDFSFKTVSRSRLAVCSVLFALLQLRDYP